MADAIPASVAPKEDTKKKPEAPKAVPKGADERGEKLGSHEAFRKDN